MFGKPVPVDGPPAPLEAVPGNGVLKIKEMIDQYAPIIESATGLTRKELVLQLFKSGINGDGLNSVLGNLMGKPPVKTESKLIRYVKFSVMWGPAAVILFGGSIVLVIWFAQWLL